MFGTSYGGAKVYRHNLSENGTMDQLFKRPIVSKTGTATYQQAKYLGKLLSPLSQS